MLAIVSSQPIRRRIFCHVIFICTWRSSVHQIAFKNEKNLDRLCCNPWPHAKVIRQERGNQRPMMLRKSSGRHTVAGIFRRFCTRKRNTTLLTVVCCTRERHTVVGTFIRLCSRSRQLTVYLALSDVLSTQLENKLTCFKHNWEVQSVSQSVRISSKNRFQNFEAWKDRQTVRETTKSERIL